MAITPLPPLDRTSPSFRSSVDTFFGSGLPAFVGEANALAASMSELAEAGANGYRFTFDSSTAAGDPGTGELRLNSADAGAATAMYLSATTATAAAIGAMLDTFDDSTSSTKGLVRIVKSSDPSKYVIAKLTAISGSGAYRTATLTPVAASSSAPFVAGEALSLQYAQVGDKGDQGVQGTPGLTGAMIFLGSATVGAAVAQIDFLSIFSSTYDRYVIEIQDAGPSVADILVMRLAASGAALTGTSYNEMGVDGAGGTAVSRFSLSAGSQVQVAGSGAHLTVDVRNANSGNAYKGADVRGTFNSQAVFRAGTMLHNGALSGFRLYWSSGANFSKGTVRVYGIRNS